MSAGVVVGVRSGCGRAGRPGLALVSWLVRSELRQRRKARYFARLAAQYRKARPALPSSAAREPDPRPDASPTNTPRPVVTVAELVARVEAEGLPTRLRWDEEEEHRRGPDDDEWPTGILPRVEEDE